MRRIRVQYLDDDVDEYKCRTASYGPDSRNLVLYDVVDPVTGRTISERTLLPLASAVSVEERAW